MEDEQEGLEEEVIHEMAKGIKHQKDTFIFVKMMTLGDVKALQKSTKQVQTFLWTNSNADKN